MTAPFSPADLEVLPRPVRQRVRTLGHAFSRVRAGLVLLQQRLARGAEFGGDPAWLNRWTADLQPLPLPVNTALGTSIAWQDHEWRVLSPLAAESQSASLPGEWLQALFLLQLPVLKTFWQQTLRTSRFALLQRVLPRVWPLDPAPLPPGACLAGLDLASWQDLPRLLAQGRSFAVASLDQPTESLQAVTPVSWPALLGRAQQERLVVLELRSSPYPQQLWAQWAEADGWIDLQTLNVAGG